MHEKMAHAEIDRLIDRARQHPEALTTWFALLPEAFAASFDPDAPWALLGEPLDAVLARLPSSGIAVRLLPEVHLAGDRIPQVGFEVAHQATLPPLARCVLLRLVLLVDAVGAALSFFLALLLDVRLLALGLDEAAR